MKLRTQHDVSAPIADLYDGLSDTRRWENAAMRRGIKVQRTDGGKGLVPGAAWQIQATFRGKDMDITLQLAEAARPEKMVFTGDSNLFSSHVTVELTPLAPRQTRVVITAEVKPKTLAATIILQSVNIAKGKVQKRMAQLTGKALSDFGALKAGA